MCLPNSFREKFKNEPSNIFRIRIFFNTSMAFELISIALSNTMELSFLTLSNSAQYWSQTQENSHPLFLIKFFENTAVALGYAIRIAISNNIFVAKVTCPKFSCSVLKFILLFIFPYSFSFSISPYFVTVYIYRIENVLSNSINHHKFNHFPTKHLSCSGFLKRHTGFYGIV